MSFHFVSKIHDRTPDRLLDGSYVVPTEISRFPPWLVTEAVGQLAAWLVMARNEFKNRPVAAVCGDALIHHQVQPGDTVELAVQIDRIDRQTVVYDGQAAVGGRPVLELKRCIGPLLPMEEFDDPAKVAERYRTLVASGIPSSTAWGVDPIEPVILDHESGEHLNAAVHIPEQAEFFADHFPRRPVFPATLLLGSMSRAALVLAADAVHPTAAAHLHATRIRDIKVRSFTPPGGLLELHAQTLAASATRAEVAVQAKSDGRRVATAWIEISRALDR